MKSIAIHQPEFMPWLGFFHKMRLAQLYIVFDHVQFKKRYFENRNRIVSPQGETLWIGVPVKSKGRYVQPLAEVEIDEDDRWRRKMLERVRHAYGRAPHFEPYYDDLARTVREERSGRLVALNLALIGFFRRHFGIETPMALSSSFGVEAFKASSLILELCLRSGATRYLCGASGRDYLAEDDFARAGVAIDYLNYTPPAYPQLCPVHVSHLSSLDLLFNHGPQAPAILAGGGRPRENQP